MSGATTEFFYDGDRLVAEYSGTTLLRRYVHGPGVDEPLLWYEGASTTDRRWLIADRQGSVIAATNSSGALVGNVYRYGPYGEPESWSGSRFSYTGQIMLSELQLYHYKARVYSPTLGRFLQTDPVGYEDDLNLYAYVRNDPLNLYDPKGERVIVVGGGGEGYTDERISNSVRPYVDRFREQYGGRIDGPVEFYRHFDVGGIQRSIFEGAENGEPIIVIGHSWGASTAFKVLAETGVSAILVTIDPVGGAGDHRPGNLLAWINIELEPSGQHASDLVEAGGDLAASAFDPNPSLPTQLADVNQTVEGTHADFESAMQTRLGGRSTEERVVNFGSRVRR